MLQAATVPRPVYDKKQAKLLFRGEAWSVPYMWSPEKSGPCLNSVCSTITSTLFGDPNRSNRIWLLLPFYRSFYSVRKQTLSPKGSYNFTGINLYVPHCYHKSSNHSKSPIWVNIRSHLISNGNIPHILCHRFLLTNLGHSIFRIRPKSR